MITGATSRQDIAAKQKTIEREDGLKMRLCNVRLPRMISTCGQTDVRLLRFVFGPFPFGEMPFSNSRSRHEQLATFIMMMRHLNRSVLYN